MLWYSLEVPCQGSSNYYQKTFYGKIRKVCADTPLSWLGDLVVSALDFQAGYRGFESRSDWDNFQIISMPYSHSTCPGLSIKWTGQHLVTNSGTKWAWVIHKSKAVQIHVHNNRRNLYVPRVHDSVKIPHNNNNPHLSVAIWIPLISKASCFKIICYEDAKIYFQWKIRKQICHILSSAIIKQKL